MILNDRQIREACKSGMISPWAEHTSKNEKGEGVLSYGISSYGYDIRLGPEFRMFTNMNNATIDPKNFDPDLFVEKFKEDGSVTLPPHSFTLTRSLERLKIPKDVLTICVGKSTYARCGLIVNVTPLEPEWEGHITLEISNTTPSPALVYAGEGICQLLFLRGMPCETTYADRKGKYNHQTGVVNPKV
jgi:dCTP deaminase